MTLRDFSPFFNAAQSRYRKCFVSTRPLSNVFLWAAFPPIPSFPPFYPFHNFTKPHRMTIRKERESVTATANFLHFTIVIEWWAVFLLSKILQRHAIWPCLCTCRLRKWTSPFVSIFVFPHQDSLRINDIVNRRTFLSAHILAPS